MPEQAPELIEQVGSEPWGAVWRARLPDGTEALAHQTLLADESSRQAALDRLRRLARIPAGHLAPIRGWWADGAGVWFVGDLEQGIALPELPGGGFLSPQQASAISFGVLEGLLALHGEGLSHAALGPDNVRVMPDGTVLLSGHQLSTLGFPTQDDLVKEVRESGRLICQAFGITPERTGGAPRAIEHAAPALVVTARAIAAGTMRSDLRASLAAMRETSGPLAGPERLALGASELGALVTAKRSGTGPGELRFRSLSAPIGSGSMAATPGQPPPARQNAPPAPPPPLTPSPSTPAAASPVAAAGADAAVPPRRTWEERKSMPARDEMEPERTGPNWLLIGGALVLLLVVGLGVWAGRGLLAGSPVPGGEATPAPAASTFTSASPTARPTPTPGVIPTFAPAAAGAVKGVALKAPAAGCSPGTSCTFNVVITFTPAGSPHDVTWTFKVYNPCTGNVADAPGGTITAQGDWNTTDGNTTVGLAAAKSLYVVALSGPDVAASSPLQVGSGGC